MHPITRLLPGLLVAVLATACAGAPAASAPAASAPVVDIEATEFAFKPATVNLSAAGAATIRIVNKGIAEHDVTVDSIKFTVLAKPGESVSGTATFAPGTYDFYCSIPGHKQAGMVGTITVK